MITQRRMAALAAILLLMGGVVLGGHGLFIRAKAVVAQVLLERAWAETVETRRPVKAWAWADTWRSRGSVFRALAVQRSCWKSRAVKRSR